VRKSAHGVAISAKVARSLEEIVGKARQVDELAGEVASASKEQSQGIEQVNTAVSQMDKVTQSNAASAEESASAAEELNAQADALKEAVAELLQLVDGSREGGGRRAEDGGGRTEVRGQWPNGHKAPATIPLAKTQRNGTRTKPSLTAVPTQVFASRRQGGEIPMDGGFKDF